MKGHRLAIRTKLGFGVCDLGGNMFYTVTVFWLMNFLTDTVGLAASLAGIALMIGRVWDAVTDPAVGYISDLTRTPWGRRRPYIFVGAIALAAAMFVMFTAPSGDQMRLFLWATIAYCFLCFAYTLVSIPYSSLTPELTADYNERTSLNGFRMSFAVVGTLIGAGAFLPLVKLFGGGRAGHSATGTIFGIIMLVTALITVASVRERKLPKKTTRMPVLRSYASALTSRPFLIVVLTWMFATVAATMISGSLIYYFKYIYRAPDSATNIALLIMLGTTMVCIPLWVLVAKRLEKKVCYIIGMSLLAAMVMLFYFFGERGGLVFAYAAMGVSGVGLATHYVFPWSMVPDAIEYDRARTGLEREGLFYGMWTFVSKLGGALGAFLMGAVFAASGYLPNVVQSVSAQTGIKLVFGPLAAVFFVIAAGILYFYPIDRAMYEKLKRR